MALSREASSPIPMEQFFDERATSYEAHMARHPEASYWRELLEKQIPKSDSITQILDLGCGTGLEIPHLIRQQPRAQITCIDLSEQMLCQLRSKFPNLLPQLHIIKASYLDYPFPTKTFNQTIACVTLHHWLHPIKLDLYKRIFASLISGGSFIINDYFVPESEESKLLLAYQDMLHSGLVREGQCYHIDVPFSINHEIGVLKEAGFKRAELIEDYYSKDFNAGLIVADK